MAQLWKSRCINYIHEIFIIFLSILFSILLFPIVYPIFGLLLLQRKFVIYLAKWRHSSWIPSSIIGGPLCIDETNERQINSGGFSVEFEQPFDYTGFIERVEKFLESNRRPELKCFIRRWCTTYFLVPCANFSVSSVVSINYSDDYEHASEILDRFHNAPFVKSGPVWGIGIFPNLKPNYITVLVKAHHGLLDGFSGMSFLSQLCDPDPEADVNFKDKVSEITNKLAPTRSCCSWVILGLQFVFVTPFLYFYKISRSIRSNIWTNTKGTGKEWVRHSQKFDLSSLQKIARNVGHSTIVLFAGALVGAIREEMKSRGDSVSQDIILGYVLPLPGHPHEKHLTNALIMAPATLPISVDDRKQRLLRIMDMFQDMTNPSWLLHCYIFTLLFHLPLTLLGIHWYPKFVVGGVWSNIIVFIADRKIMGKRISNVELNIGIQYKGIPVMYVSYSMHNHIFLTTIGDKAIFTEKHNFTQFFARVEHELNCYSKLDESNCILPIDVV